MADKPMKTENGMQFPAEAYAYVPDPEHPSTWKLRLWEDPEQKETPRQVGMAVAALSPGGFRGNRVEIPKEDWPKVIARVRAAWKKVHPDADPEDIPPILRESTSPGVVGGKDASQDGTQRLLEYSTNRGLALRVDREKSIIYGVKILGMESQNGRRYLPDALAQARQLYEGAPVNVDHRENGRRSYRDRIGRLMNVRLGADGLYGDLLVNPKHPLAEQLFWDAEHCPENVGLSHDAQGRTRVEGRTVVVESIDRVRSVDLVAEPATTRSLYEDVAIVDAPPSQSADSEADAPTAGSQSEPEAADEIEDVDRLPDDAFALVLPGGVKIGERTWPLHKRWFPIHTPQAVLRSLERIATNRKLSQQHLEQAKQRALEAASRFGLDVSRWTNTVVAKEGVDHMELSTLTLEQLKEARPDLVAAIQSSADAQNELVRLAEERDRLAAELAAIRQREAVREELNAVGLLPSDIPPTILETLYTAQDATRKRLIEDLRKLVRPARPVSVRSGLATTFEERVRAWRT